MPYYLFTVLLALAVERKINRTGAANLIGLYPVEVVVKYIYKLRKTFQQLGLPAGGIQSAAGKGNYRLACPAAMLEINVCQIRALHDARFEPWLRLLKGV